MSRHLLARRVNEQSLDQLDDEKGVHLRHLPGVGVVLDYSRTHRIESGWLR
jgi:hypothetical protein